jgi:hypothetical protein
MSEADDLQLGAKLARMEVLFNAAIKSSVTDHALEWLAAAQLLLRVADEDADVARGRSRRGFDPETIAPHAVALVAATYLGEDVRELAQVTEQEGVAKRLAKP